MKIVEKNVLSHVKDIVNDCVVENTNAVVITTENAHNKTVMEVLSRFLRLYPIYIKEETYSIERAIILESSVRSVFGVGGEKEMQVCKALSKRYNLPLVFIVTEACGCCNYDNAILYDNYFLPKIKEGKRADIVVCDTTVISEYAPFYGLCEKALVHLLESEIDFALSGERKSEINGIYTALLRCIELEKKGDLIGVIKNSLSLGYEGIDGAISTAAAYRLIFEKSNKKVKPLLETSVILAPKILQIYRLFLALPLINTTYVCNNNQLLDALYSSLGINPVRAIKSMPKYCTHGEIERAIFCINSFKSELISKAKIFDKTAQFIITRFKRLYKDRGFSYNEYVDNQALRRALCYSSAMGGKSTIINLLLQTGYLQ